MKKILITGGGGFIGSEIVNQLYKLNMFEIRVLDVFSKQVHGENFRNSYLYKRIEGKCEVVIGDICDINIVNECLKGIDVVIHLASETGTGQSMYEVRKYSDVNIIGIANIMDAIINNKYDIKKIILASSRSIYGEGSYICSEHNVVFPLKRSINALKSGDYDLYCPFCNRVVYPTATSETANINPNSFYALTKSVQEQMIRYLSDVTGIPYTIFRYQNVYGAGQSLSNPYTGILSIFSQRFLGDKEINVFEDGKESRDFVHVEDVARITINAISNSKTDYETLNVGSGKQLSVLDLANKMKELTKSNSIIKISGQFRVGDIKTNFADITKAINLADYSPMISFETGLGEFIDWAKKEVEKTAYIEKSYHRSLDELEQRNLLINIDKK